MKPLPRARSARFRRAHRLVVPVAAAPLLLTAASGSLYSLLLERGIDAFWLLKIHTGSDTFVRPSMGAWISYGLGTENENLPSFVTINPTLGHGGVRNFGSAFLPPIHQATRIGSSGSGMKEATIENLTNDKVSPDLQTLQLGLLADLDRLKRQRPITPADAALQARIDSFELAFRMQTSAPKLLDISDETEATLKLYGIDGGPTDNYGRQCLMARRMSESGVRFVQASHA